MQRIILLISTKYPIVNLFGIALNHNRILISLGRIDILTILSLSFHEHGVSLFTSLIFLSVFRNFHSIGLEHFFFVSMLFIFLVLLYFLLSFASL